MMSSSRVSVIPELYAAMDYGDSQDAFPAAKNWLIGKDLLKCFYDGKLACTTQSGEYKSQLVKDPCSDDNLASLVAPSVEDIGNALQSSLQGKNSWSNLNQHGRGKFISSIAKKCKDLIDLLAEVEALTIGVSLSETKQEISRAASYFSYYAATAHVVQKEVEDLDNGVILLCFSKPAPFLALATTVAPALAAGHAVLINPPLEAPLMSFVFAELCTKAGLPPGVINVVPGSLEEAKEGIIKEVKKIVSWGTGNSCRSVSSDIADILCPIVPFHFGKGVSLVFDSADHSSAIEILLKNMNFSYQQMPWAVRTILVEESAFPSFVTVLKKKFSSKKAGNARGHGNDIGLPKMSDAKSVAYLKDALTHLQQRGIEVIQIPVADSVFFPPTLIIGTDAEINSIEKSDNILPFVSVVPFRNTKEALDFANKSHFGEAASVWTSCISLAMYTASKLKVGSVWVNDHGLVDPSVPFSRIGSRRGLLPFLSVKKTENVSAEETNASPSTTKTPVQKKYFPCTCSSEENTCVASFSVISSTGGHFLVHECDRNEIKKAIGIAQSAQQKWWKVGSNARAALLLQVADEFQETSSEFLKYTQNSISECEKELDSTVNNLYDWALRCNNMLSFKNDYPVPNYVVQCLQEPTGVIGILLEGSSELETFALAVIAALAFGNSVVVLLNYKNPVLALEFCAFLTKLKLPAGLINVLSYSKSTLYSELVYHKDVESVWYSSNNKALVDTLNKMANKMMKFLWKIPKGSAAWKTLEFEYAASFTKTIWIQNESSSC